MRPKPTSGVINAGAPKGCKQQFRVFAGQGSLSLVAAAAAAEGEKPKLPTITMAAYNGGAMDVGWGLSVVIDLKGLDVSGHARPILKDHDPGQVVGHTTKISKVDGKSLAIEATVSGTGAAAQEVVANAGNGFPWQASVGVAARNYEYVKEGSTAKANGQEFTGPLYIVRKGVLAESSVVAIGADSTTTTSIAARNHGDTTMKFEDWLKAKGFDHDSMSEDQRTTLRAAYDAEVKADGDGGDADPAAGGDDAGVLGFRKAQASETKRVTAIRKVCKGLHGEIEAKAIEDGWTSEKTELEVLRAERAKAPQAPAGIARGSTDLAIRGKAIAAALCLSAGVSEKLLASDKENTDQVMNAAVSREYRNIGLQALMHETILAAGGHVRPGRIDNDDIRAAFDANRKLIASGYSGIALTNVLGAVANKVALQAFTAAGSVAMQFAQLYDANDFKTNTFCRLSSNGSFQKVGPTGELKHGNLSEDTGTNKLDTRGMLLTLSRQDIYNDDLGQFNSLVSSLGRLGAVALETEAFTVLMANTGNFFSAGNKNYISGTDTVLSIDGLKKAFKTFKDMTDSAGNPIMVSPKYLLVGSALEYDAGLYMTEKVLNETTTADKGKPARNLFAGLAIPLSSPFINNTNITNNSATAWFLIADPADVPCLQLAFLRGQRTPTVENGDTDFATLGMSWRGFFDFGASLIDKRGAVMSKGAA